VGMAALDAIRIEQNLPRYGHEVNETLDPATAGLLDRVSPRQNFLGAAAIAELSRRGPSRRRVQLKFPGENVSTLPRLGDTVFNTDHAEIGTVTSGTWSPTHQCPIALVHIATSHDDKNVFAQLANARIAATVV